METRSDLLILAAKLDLPRCAGCRVVLRPQRSKGMDRKWCSSSCRSWRRRHARSWTYRPRDVSEMEAETLGALAAWAEDGNWIAADESAALLRLTMAGL